MQLCHTPRASSAVFDDPNLVSAAGLVPVLALASAAGLSALALEHLTVPTDKGANAGLKVASLVAGMVAGADSIDDMALLRHGAMGRLFDRAYAPSTLGSFLRAFTFGHVRQLDAVASRFLAGLIRWAPMVPAGGDGLVLLDVDDTVIEVHGYAKQGAGFGYSRVRGLNALLATVSAGAAAPVIVAQRLRKGSCGSARRGCCCARTRRSMAPIPSVRRWPVVPTCRSRCAWTRWSTRPSRRSRPTRGPRSSTPRRSGTTLPGRGSPGPRSPRSPI